MYIVSFPVYQHLFHRTLRGCQFTLFRLEHCCESDGKQHLIILLSFACLPERLGIFTQICRPFASLFCDCLLISIALFPGGLFVFSLDLWTSLHHSQLPLQSHYPEHQIHADNSMLTKLPLTPVFDSSLTSLLSLLQPNPSLKIYISFFSLCVPPT